MIIVFYMSELIYNIFMIYINRKKVDICTSIPKWRDKGYFFSQTDL